MKQYRFLLIIVTAVFALLGAAALFGDNGAIAQENGEMTAAAVGAAFTYQGQLSDDQGQPLSGAYDFEFRLYDGSGGGAAQIGPTITVDDKQVENGRFTLRLDFGANVFTGNGRWLDISVRDGGDSGAYTQLSPRQELTPAPYALYAEQVPWSGVTGAPARNDHDHLGQTWTGADNTLVLTGTFDTNFPNAPLFLGNTGDGFGLVVEAPNGSGVSVNSPGDDGVYVDGAGGHGVRVNNPGDSGLYVDSADDGVEVENSTTGMLVTSAAHYGVLVGSAGYDGLAVGRAGAPSYTIIDPDSSNGLEVSGAEGDGVFIGHADDDGFGVNTAGDDGLHIQAAGDPRLQEDSTLHNGVVVEGAEGHGLWIGHADNNGIVIDGADRYGILVRNADRDNSGGEVAGRFVGDVEVTGNVINGGGGFQIDHPLAPENMTLAHNAVGSPEMTTVYNGNVTTDGEGFATVTLPDYFEALNTDYRYQLTVIGTFAQAIIAEEIADNRFVIQTDEPNVKVSWQVTGVRQDAYAQANPITVEEEKPEEEQGLYLHPEAYGQPPAMGAGYAEEEAGQ